MIFNMKTIRYIIIGSVFAMFSCTDLDVLPKDLATGDGVLGTLESYESFLAKIYTGLTVTGQAGQGGAGNSDITTNDEGFYQYMRLLWKAQELPTEEAIIVWNDRTIKDFHEQDWTSQDQFLTAMFNRVYFQIGMANEFLRETTDAKLAERNTSDALYQTIQRYKAEARFLRALSYWHGLDLFANIPLVTEESVVGKEPPAQNTRAEIFSFVESEVLAIEPLLGAPRFQYGSADKGAAWMLLAKLYLNAEVYVGQNRYNDCITYCEKIIDEGGYALEDVYQHSFTADNNLSSEIIFAVFHDGLAARSFGGTNFIIHASTGNNDEGGGFMDPAAIGADGGWGGLKATSGLVDLFPDPSGSTDERAFFYRNAPFTREITDVNTWNTGGGFPVLKFTNLTSEGDPGKSGAYMDTDFPMFRLADVYLMYAEAVERGGTGSETDALNYVNDLRERAFNGPSGNIIADDLTLDFLIKERGRELYWEAHRRTDLVRFNQFTENGIWPWKGGVADGTTTAKFRDVYPIPASELAANPKLDQNPNY